MQMQMQMHTRQRTNVRAIVCFMLHDRYSLLNAPDVLHIGHIDTASTFADSANCDVLSLDMSALLLRPLTYLSVRTALSRTRMLFLWAVFICLLDGSSRVLTLCASKHCLQKMWPHVPAYGWLNGQRQMPHSHL